MSKPETFAERKARLRRELEAMERDEQDIARLKEKYGAQLIELVGGSPVPFVEREESPPRRINVPDPESLTSRCKKLAEEVIRERGHPVPLEDLRQAAAERGIVLKGKQPASVLSAFISHSKTFLFVPGKGWWLRDKPLPESNVVPAFRSNKESKSRRAQVVQAVEDYLRQKGSRAQTPELIPMLQARGIDLGNNAKNTVAAYLSASDLFDNGRTSGGYGLVEWNTEGQQPPPNGKLPLEAMK